MIDSLRSATRRRNGLGLAVLGLLWLHPLPLGAGGTPATGTVTDELQTMGGGGAEALTGDFISSFFGTVPTDNLDAVYEYFIEVPTGASTLEVDVFDADVLAGAGDIVGERDQDRTTTSNTKVRYQLFDPDGNLVAVRFSYGDDDANNPPNADNAWKSFFDSSTAGITGGDTFLDNFTTDGSYAGDDSMGGVSWTADWIEANDLGGAGPGVGDVQVVGGELSMDNQSAVSPFTNQPSLEREADLSAYAAAELSFDWRTDIGVDRMANNIANLGDSIAIEASSDGGTTYSIIDEFGGIVGADSGSAVYDITDFISATTRIRFRITNRYAGTDETIFFDDVQIRGVTTANGPTPAAGHWKIEVDMTGDVNGHLAGTTRVTNRQNDVNAFGLRAHDGTPGAGGTEYNLYAQSYVVVGINDNGSSRTYDLYPYITKGCDFDANDWDWDASQMTLTANVSPFGDIDYSSRSGDFTDSNTTMSDNASWQTYNVSGFASAEDSDDYGIWDIDILIEDWGQNNYGPVYLGAHDAAAAPPTAQPEPNTFRIYFPTDADAAPAKPYLSQFLRFVPSQSTGGNPPGVGQTSRYAISLVLTNPAGSIGDIALSASRVVTAHLPADPQLAYRGVAILSQGSVVSEPALGGTGNITWNAGTLAPGDEEILTYLVDVTPSAVGNITVTGTVGSGDGTRATWLDETEHVATGVFDFGELCELSVVTAPATPVLVSSMDARLAGADVVLEWKTAAEAGTAHFDLFRLGDGGAEKLNREPLAAQIGHPQGGTYRFVDKTAPDHATLHYQLLERESSGRTKVHGPFAVTPTPSPGAPDVLADYERTPHPPQDSHFERLRRAENPPTGGIRDAPAAAAGPVEALRLEIGETGLYRLTAKDLAKAFGLATEPIQRGILRGRFHLSSGGEDITWIKGPRGQYLEFVGHAVDTPFTENNVYRLSFGQGTAIAQTGRALPLPPDWADGTFRSDLHLEDATFGVTLLGLDPESDLWFWDFVMPGANAVKALDAEVFHPVASGDDATLTVHLQGGTLGSHLVAFRLGGQEVGQVALEDLEALSAELSVPASLLADGANTLEVESLGGGLVLIDSFDLSYDRWLRPSADSLVATVESRTQASVSPFTGSSVRVLDISDRTRPRLARSRTVQESGGTRVIWRAETGGPYLAVSSLGLLTPQISIDHPSDLRSSAHEVDYLVVTTTELMAAAGTLADYRASQGLATLVVDIQDVYDEFSHGLRDVRALRGFLEHTAKGWNRAPSYVLIAAAGTYDHRDELGLGGNLISVLQGSRGDSLFAADATLADHDGDGVMDVAIGRLPVVSAAELDAYTQKVMFYETGGDWIDQVTLLADRDDGDTSFAADLGSLERLLPVGYDTTLVDLEQTVLADARQQLFDAVNTGSAWVHFSGHGGVDRFSALGLMTSTDVATLANDDRLTVVSSASCHIGLHALPGFDSLGEFLVLEEDGGAAAVIAPTWLSDHAEARLLGDRLFRSVFQQETPRLGDALRGALASALGVAVEPHLLLSYQILGDPALVLQRRPTPPEGDETCLPDEECDG